MTPFESTMRAKIKADVEVWQERLRYINSGVSAMTEVLHQNELHDDMDPFAEKLLKIDLKDFKSEKKELEGLIKNAQEALK